MTGTVIKRRLEQEMAGEGGYAQRGGAARQADVALRSAMDAVQVGLFVLQDQRVVYANPCLCRLFGYAADELVGARGLLDLFGAEFHPMLVQQWLPGETVGGAGLELTARRQDGSEFPVTLLGAVSWFAGKPAIVGTVFDLTSQKAAEAKIRELAEFDALTGLPNRRLLRDRVTQLLAVAERDSTPVAVMFVDLDHFKRVNDSLGHSIGDELLCAVAQRLGTVVRRGDTLARLGGDEFVLVMPGLHTATAADIARRLAEECSQPFAIGGHELTVTPSIGISVYPQDGEDIETLLKNADVAMYKAKELGRNTFQFFAADMNTATLDRLLMESNLRRALKQKEFVLHYQPLVSLRSGLIVGVEALIRWQHPDLGCIMPDRFIHVAEETGLINQIGDWVLIEACHQAQAWIEQGLAPLTMAVNVAPGQFRQAGFVEAVAGALGMSGLEPGLLELEVTERTVMHEADLNMGTLNALHRMGVELSLDDFGTGYSSLAYLKRIPVGKLKIDRSFVCDLVTNADDQAIASTIVSMGRNLRLTVLAEGVETAEQLQLLRNMDCDMAQGYHFSRPLAADQLSDLLRRQPFTF